MKYINKFNENNSLFNKLNYHDLVKFDINSKVKISFTPNEIQTLKTCFKSNNILWMRTYEIDIKSIVSNIEVTKLEDEWFYVRMIRNNQHYKCDGMDGLIQFLKKYLH